jgi:hypothetical protein
MNDDPMLSIKSLALNLALSLTSPLMARLLSVSAQSNQRGLHITDKIWIVNLVLEGHFLLLSPLDRSVPVFLNFVILVHWMRAKKIECSDCHC